MTSYQEHRVRILDDYVEIILWLCKECGRCKLESMLKMYDVCVRWKKERE